jgi:hypothetical protein
LQTYVDVVASDALAAAVSSLAGGLSVSDEQQRKEDSVLSARRERRQSRPERAAELAFGHA